MSTQGATKHLVSATLATTSTSAASDLVSSAHSGVTAASKPPGMRSRALSLQARATNSSECVCVCVYNPLQPNLPNVASFPVFNCQNGSRQFPMFL